MDARARRENERPLGQSFVLAQARRRRDDEPGRHGRFGRSCSAPATATVRVVKPKGGRMRDVRGLNEGYRLSATRHYRQSYSSSIILCSLKDDARLRMGKELLSRRWGRRGSLGRFTRASQPSFLSTRALYTCAVPVGAELLQGLQQQLIVDFTTLSHPSPSTAPAPIAFQCMTFHFPFSPFIYFRPFSVNI
jgi:hypothetical protein